MINIHPGLPDFKLEPRGPVSALCRDMEISSFHELCGMMRNLPYGRNKNKNDLISVFKDQCGTCSTKHALLKQVADEHGQKDIRLVLCIFKMNSDNTVKVKDVLKEWNLDYIPEAHNYLKYNGRIFDFTGPGFDPENYGVDILEEINLTPGQITEFKVALHKEYLNKWLAANPQIKLSNDKLWEAREQCIHALFTT